jgi:cytochrome c oxidase subunit 4
MAQQQDHGHHVIPASILAKTAVALTILTILTVAAARMHLGMFAAPVAFLIAAVKAFLVMSFFMGLKYEVRENRIVFSLGFVFLAILFFFCALDIWTRINIVSTL